MAAADRGARALRARSRRDPLPFLEAMTKMASPGGMLPEQVWDADPIPSRRLAPGRPSGSAMPLVWAHAEFIKLMVSRRLVHPVDRPCAIWWLYQGRRPTARYAFWCPHAPIRESHAGTRLAIALPRPALVTLGSWRLAQRSRRAGPRQRSRLPCRGTSLLGTPSTSPGNGERTAPGMARTIKSRAISANET